ncbi:DUF4328 domain-containing protein [Streptomyces sp. NBC_00876]|uniref:DUF4328 domain-containing protein n=1 Tax=Streptomyces sp. NBC_00876 TaxID=2975853 RepID=UPI0038642D6B|nr:DUF4328 domain-containing protein [Streptomyces sp. NBC_00876]
MLCSNCGTRPAGTADGRCTVCAGFRRAQPGGLMAMPQGLQPLRSPVGLAKAVCVLLGVAAVADVLAVASGFNARQAFGEAMADDFESYDEEVINHADTLYQSAGAFQLLILLATGIVFLIWFRRVRLNAEVFDARAHTMRPGWAVGGWFVPFGNLWLPCRVASGVWTASSPGGRTAPAPRGLLYAWWAALICTQLLSRSAGQLYDKAEEADEVMDGLALVIASDALDIVAAVLAILFVRRLTAMQGERAALGPRSDNAPLPAERAEWRRAH